MGLSRNEMVTIAATKLTTYITSSVFVSPVTPESNRVTGEVLGEAESSDDQTGCEVQNHAAESRNASTSWVLAFGPQ